MFDYLAMSFKDADYTIVITLVYWQKCTNFCAETHLGGLVMSAFVFRLTTIARVPRFNFHLQYTLRKGQRRFWLHCYYCWCALTFMCQNSRWWRSCEYCIGFLLAAIAHSTQTAWSLHDMYCKLATWNYMESLYNLLPRVWLPFQRRKNVSLTVGYNVMTVGWTLRWVHYERKTNLCYEKFTEGKVKGREEEGKEVRGGGGRGGGEAGVWGQRKMRATKGE